MPERYAITDLADCLMGGCRHAFLIGATQKNKKQLKQSELWDRVNWVQGFHKPLVWQAYKSGLWVKEENFKGRTP